MNLVEKTSKIFVAAAMSVNVAGCAAQMPRTINENYTNAETCMHFYAKGFQPGFLPLPGFMFKKSSVDRVCVDKDYTISLLENPNPYFRSIGMNFYKQMPPQDQDSVKAALLKKDIKMEDLEKTISFFIRMEKSGNCVNSYYSVPGQEQPAIAFNCDLSKSPTP